MRIIHSRNSFVLETTNAATQVSPALSKGTIPDCAPIIDEKKYSSQGEGGTLDGAISLYLFFVLIQANQGSKLYSFERIRHRLCLIFYAGEKTIHQPGPPGSPLFCQAFQTPSLPDQSSDPFVPVSGSL
jgi:hypothetical protein